MKTPRIEPYLMFGGRCDEAIAFYTKAVGAKLEMLMRYKDSPEPMPEGMLPPGFEDKVMHASFLVGDSRVMLSDGCSTEIKFVGVSVSITVAGEAEAEKTFNALADGGKVTMPLTRTFWCPKFGMLTDKFGLDWMVSVAAEHS